MINSVSNSSARTNFAQRDYVIVDGKRHPVVKRQNSNPLVSTFAPVYRDVVFIDGKEYPVQEVPDFTACDKTKKTIIVDGRMHDVNPSLLNIILADAKIPSRNETQPKKLDCEA